MHEVGLHEKSCLAAAGTADHQHVFVPGRLGVFGPVVHGEAFRLRQENVVIENRVDVRGYIFGAAPPGAAVFLPLAVFLGVLAFAVHHQPQGGGTGDADQQVKAVEAGGRIFKGCRKSARKVQQLFPTGRPLLPAGTPGPACRTGTQTVDRAGWRLSVS